MPTDLQVAAGKGEALHHFGSWTKDGDETVARALVSRFGWFEEGENSGCLLDGWNIRVVVG